MPKIYLEENVLDAAFKRIEIILSNFNNVYFCLSAGKDSSVMVQLANIVAKKLNKKFDILYIDLEAQFKCTIDHLYELKELSQIRDFYHIALPLALRNATSVLQPKWICWEEESKNLWIRDLPKDSINMSNNPFKFFKKGEEFEDFMVQFAAWYQKKYNESVACGIGIRTDESLNRFRTIAFQKHKEEFQNYHWTTKLKSKNKTYEVYNFYPIYDFKVEDIWGTVSKFDFKYNQIYELMYKNGLNIHLQRICQPYGDDQKNGLDQFRALEYETWEKVLNRVNGVNFGNIYCRSTALGVIKSCKPRFMKWQEYAIFLLESIGIYNPDLMYHYYEKIKKFIAWYEKTENITLENIPEEAPPFLENTKKTISWRRIARAVEKNDFYMKRLGFAQTKTDDKKLEIMAHKWDNLLTSSTDTDDKDLLKFINKRSVKNDNKNK